MPGQLLMPKPSSLFTLLFCDAWAGHDTGSRYHVALHPYRTPGVLCAVLTAHVAATRLRRACSQTADTQVRAVGWAALCLSSCCQASAGRRAGQQRARRGAGAGRRHAGAAARAAAHALAAGAGLVPARAACAAGRGRAGARHHPAHGPGRPPSAGRSARLPPGRRPLPAERCCARGALPYRSCWPRRAC